MRKPLKSKAQIIHDLGKVFRAYGFDGATISRLTDGTGLERASLYHHFPKGKKDMAEAVLLDALDTLKQTVISELETHLPASTKIEKMLAALNKFYCNGNDICFITIFSTAQTNSQISKAMRDATQYWLKNLTKVLSENKVVNAKASAQHGLASIQGALILASTTQDTKIFKNTLKQLKAMWLKP